jgi:hypothetical protein
MVWAGIIANFKTDPQFFILAHLQQKVFGASFFVLFCFVFYVQVRPYVYAVGPDFIVAQDNPRPNTACHTSLYLALKIIELLLWHARSPDLNAIVHVWNMFLRVNSCHPSKSDTLAKLCVALQDDWYRIPQLNIRRLIYRMLMCCTIINVFEHHTRYWKILKLIPCNL